MAKVLPTFRRSRPALFLWTLGAVLGMLCLFPSMASWAPFQRIDELAVSEAFHLRLALVSGNLWPNAQTQIYFLDITDDDIEKALASPATSEAARWGVPREVIAAHLLAVHEALARGRPAAVILDIDISSYLPGCDPALSKVPSLPAYCAGDIELDQTLSKWTDADPLLILARPPGPFGKDATAPGRAALLKNHASIVTALAAAEADENFAPTEVPLGICDPESRKVAPTTILYGLLSLERAGKPAVEIRSEADRLLSENAECAPDDKPGSAPRVPIKRRGLGRWLLGGGSIGRIEPIPIDYRLGFTRDGKATHGAGVTLWPVTEGLLKTTSVEDAVVIIGTSGGLGGDLHAVPLTEADGVLPGSIVLANAIAGLHTIGPLIWPGARHLRALILGTVTLIPYLLCAAFWPTFEKKVAVNVKALFGRPHARTVRHKPGHGVPSLQPAGWTHHVAALPAWIRWLPAGIVLLLGASCLIVLLPLVALLGQFVALELGTVAPTAFATMIIAAGEILHKLLSEEA